MSQKPKPENYLAPFNPTDKGAISQVVQLANFSDSDILYDLGCGDARVLIHAIKHSSLQEAVGIEYDKVYVERAKEAVSREGLEDKISIIHGDANVVDTSKATVFFVYLVPDGLKKIQPKIMSSLQCNKKCRVLSNIFSIPGLVPTKVFLYSRANLKLFLYEKQSVGGKESSEMMTRRHIPVGLALLFFIFPLLKVR